MAVRCGRQNHLMYYHMAFCIIIHTRGILRNRYIRRNHLLSIIVSEASSSSTPSPSIPVYLPDMDVLKSGAFNQHPPFPWLKLVSYSNSPQWGGQVVLNRAPPEQNLHHTHLISRHYMYVYAYVYTYIYVCVYV